MHKKFKQQLKSLNFVETGSYFLARSLLADIFIGPQDRIARLPFQPLIFVANHTWCLDGLITLLVCRSLGRELRLLSSKRVARALHCFKKSLGIIPVSTDPIANIRTLKSLVELSEPGLALWMFPQAVWIPRAWDTRSTIPEVAERLIKSLNRSVSIVPVHIELVIVRQVRPSVVVTLGEVIPTFHTSNLAVSEMLGDLRIESDQRLSSHTSEYYSILHDDGVLFCGYPIRSKAVARIVRRAINAVDFNMRPKSDGWTIKISFQQPTEESAVKDAVRNALPGVLAPWFLQYTKIEVQ
jgi:hypothetical protein